MRKPLTTLAVASFALLSGTPLSAQNHREALGLYGGGSWFSELSPSEAIDTRFETGWLAGLHVDNWLGSERVGFRVGASYADRRLETGSRSPYRMYSGELGLLVRILPAEPGRFIAPYIALGGGVMHMDAANDANPAQDDYYEDPKTLPIASIAVGADLFASSTVGLQIEVADRVLPESPFGDPALEREFRPVHHVVGRVSLMFRTKRTASPPPVLAAPRPVRRDTATVTAVEVRAAEPAEPRVAEPAVGAATPEPLTPEPAQPDPVIPAAAEPEPAPEPEPARATDAPAPSAVATAPLFTVQLGSYRDPTGARVLADRARNLGLPVWISTVTVRGATFHRVRVGATPSRVEAMELARRLQTWLQLEGWVARVEPPDAPTEETITATRAAIAGS